MSQLSKQKLTFFTTLLFISGIFSVLFSHRDKVLWTTFGAKELLQSQDELDMLTKRYLMEEFLELLATTGNSILIFAI